MKMICRAALLLALMAASTPNTEAQATQGRVSGRVLDAINASPLPGGTVEVVGTLLTTVTGLDGRYTLELARGKHEVKVALSGFAERVFTVDLSIVAAQILDVTLSLAGCSEQARQPSMDHSPSIPRRPWRSAMRPGCGPCTSSGR
jgi:hypothetical protein